MNMWRQMFDDEYVEMTYYLINVDAWMYCLIMQYVEICGEYVE